MIVGFTAGAFDLFHAGHVLMLKECKNMCDFLIVGLQTNPKIDRPEKNKPVQSIVERQIVLNSCRYVDETVIYETERDLEDILAIMDIDIRFIGADHKGEHYTGEEICTKKGIKIYYNSRNHRFSTSELRKRIKKWS